MTTNKGIILGVVRRWIVASAAVLLVTVTSTRATADLVYDNGLPNEVMGGANYVGITNTGAVSDSFNLSTASTLTGGQIALWVDTDWAPPPTNVDWYIGSSDFQSTYSGTATLISEPYNNINNGGYCLYESAFSLSTSSPLGPGTYWLTLTNLSYVSDPCNWAFWAASAAPPVDSQVAVNWYWTPGSPPVESFQLYGTPTPEPTSLTLLVSALLGLAGAFYLRRRGAKA